MTLSQADSKTPDGPDSKPERASTDPQLYKDFPNILPPDLLGFIKIASAIRATPGIIDIPSPRGGTAWITSDLSPELPPKIVLQAPSTGAKGEKYLPTIATYNFETGVRLDPSAVAENTHDQTLETLES